MCRGLWVDMQDECLCIYIKKCIYMPLRDFAWQRWYVLMVVDTIHDAMVWFDVGGAHEHRWW